jgi:hypothetical protein
VIRIRLGTFAWTVYRRFTQFKTLGEAVSCASDGPRTTTTTTDHSTALLRAPWASARMGACFPHGLGATLQYLQP